MDSPVRPPEPGRPVSLGMDRDVADATDLLAVLRAVRSQREHVDARGVEKVAREALWWMLEQPRLPRPLIRSKYPVAYPWSPGARSLLQEARSQGVPDTRLRGVVIEHLIPWNLTLHAVLDSADSFVPAQLVTLLVRHGAAAVMTVADDKQLTAKGFAHKMPDGCNPDDVWARTREAGLAVDAFAVIDASG